MSRLSVAALAAIVCLLIGCTSDPRRPAIAEAYAGPATLRLRQDIDPRSSEAATVKHGDRLEIVGRRRRFVKVRTAKGVEGWTDLRQLLSSAQMEALDEQAELARKLPSQGAATVYDALNVHTEPNRLAPSFYRIRQGESVDVVAAEASPRVPYQPRGDIIPPSQPKKKEPAKPKEQPKNRPPAAPAPKLPENWLELSKTELPPDQPPEETEPAKPVPVDDWSLVRLASGRAGWVVTGMLRMNIPDEVAQYSEGNRITSYFKMADVKDGSETRHHWLWTTLSSTRQPYQFDSFRYFIWNTRRHRYETAYIEKDLIGYYPVEVHPVQVMERQKPVTYPGFSLILEDANGVRWKKTYAFQVYRPRLVAQEKLEPSSEQHPAVASAAPLEADKMPEQKPSLISRIKGKFAALKVRLFGK